MRYDMAEIKGEQQRLRPYRDAVDTIIRGKTKSDIYWTEESVLDAIGRLICCVVDEYSVNCVHQPNSLLQTWSCCADWVKECALLGVDMTDICLHLQRFADVAAAPSSRSSFRRGPFYGMFSGGWLVDPYRFDQQTAEKSLDNICRNYPDFSKDYNNLNANAGLVNGAVVASPFPFKSRCADLFERFCRVCDVAVALLREQVEAWEAAGKRVSRIVLPPIALTYDDDDDRPKSDAEAAALTRRQSGETLMDGLRPAGRRRWEGTPRGTPLPRVGLHGSIERAIWGETGDDYRLALAADDPTVCLVKRRAKLQRWFGPPSAGISYQHAFPKSAVRRLYNAVALANRHGVVLNVRVGVSWYNLLGCAAADCQRYFEKFKKNLVQWFADNGLTAPYPALVFVHERAFRAGVDRFHTHMLMAVPETLRDAFSMYVSKALLRVLQQDKLPKDVLWVRWRKVPSPSPQRPTPITRDQWITLTYMLKGADPGVELGLNVHGRAVTVGGISEWGYEDPGQPFAGVPWGTSETLAPGSQKAFRGPSGEQFHSLLDWQIDNGALDWRELYTDYYLDQAAGRRGPQPPVLQPRAPAPLSPSNGAIVLPDWDRLREEALKKIRI